MSTLTLVRHGQAHPFQREHAALTEMGEAQGERLARFWLQQQTAFDEVHCGTLPRQTRTEQVVAACYREAGAPWPEAQHDPAWREYDAPGVLERLVPADSSLSSLAREFEQARGGPDERRTFQKMFEAAMLRWIQTPEAPGVESWPAFRDRVSGAIRRLMQGAPGRRVVVFTSGGPIGLAVQFALQAPDRSFLDVNWRIRNCSVTEFIFDRDRFSLDTFNGCPHFADATLRTYR